MTHVLEGVTLSGGYSTVSITPNDQFQFYVHEDSRPPVLIPLSIQNISVNNHLVVFGREPRVSVIEHLFSALYGLALYDVRIDVFGDELPIFDGSSKRFVETLQQFEKKKASHALKIHDCIEVRAHESFLCYEPSDQNALYIDMELHHPYIQTQRIELEISAESYIREIASSRTFVFTDEHDPRLKKLPPYGIGITRKSVYSAQPLRFGNECVRHKVLDLLGDLYVLQRRITGRIAGRNTSHSLNMQFVRAMQIR
jgi:UDP-3-O-[3-hydroxymyristoyl] N-acetylglucosamine deacetylase